METMEAWLWLITVRGAKAGDPEDQERLRVENMLREKKGLPSVEEELKNMVKK